jgi:hypothetical protein
VGSAAQPAKASKPIRLPEIMDNFIIMDLLLPKNRSWRLGS